MAQGITGGDIFYYFKGDTKDIDAKTDKVSKNIGSKLKAGCLVAGAAFTALGATIIGTLGKALNETTNYYDEVAKAASRTQTSTEFFSEMKHAVEQSGASVNTLEKSMINLNKNIRVAAKGSKGKVAVLKEMGITMAQLQKMSPEQQFIALAEGVSQIEDPVKQTTAAMELFGMKAGPDLLPLLKSGKAGIEELREEAKRLGISVDADEAKLAEEMGDAWDEFHKAIKGLYLTIGVELMPVVTQFLRESVIPMITSIREWIEENPELTRTIILVAGAIGIIAGVVGPLLILIAGLGAAWTAISAVMGVVLGPVGLVIGAIALLAAGVFLLIKYWDPICDWFKELWEKIKEIVKSAINWILGIFGTDWDEMVEITKIAWEIIKQKLTDSWEDIKEKFTAFKTTLLNIWNGVKDAFKTAIDKVLSPFKKFKDVLSSTWDFVKTKFQSAIDMVKKKWEAFKDVFKNGYKYILDVWKKIKAFFGFGDKKIENAEEDIPKYASGTRFHPGGLAWTGEYGPELVNLPRGAEVIPHRESSAIASQIAQQKTTNLGGINVTINTSGNVNGAQIARELYSHSKMRMALAGA